MNMDDEYEYDDGWIMDMMDGYGELIWIWIWWMDMNDDGYDGNGYGW